MLREKNAEFSLRYVDLKHKPEWFLALSPRGKVPLLVADGTTLFESAAINEFLDETQPPRLLPDDPFARALQRAWVEVANDLFAVQYRLLSASTKDALDNAKRELGALLVRIDGAVGDRLLDTERLGLAQIAMAPALYRFVVMGERLSEPFLQSAPRVDAWARAIVKLPSVRDAVPPDFVDRYLDILVERGSLLARAVKGEP